MLNAFTDPEERIDHLASEEEVFEKQYKKEPRSNVRLRMGVFSGGGARGLITLYMLKGIEKKLAKANKARNELGHKTRVESFIETLDVVSGTSTGAIIACLLALRKSNDPNSPDFKKPKYTVDQVIEKYKTYLPEIFGKSKLNVAQAFIPPYTWQKVLNVGRGIYSNVGLKKILEEEVGDMEFNEKNFLIPVSIPVVDLTNNKSITFRSDDKDKNGKSLKNKVSDILLATTAATPFLFSHTAEFEFKDENEEVVRQEITAADGGFFANTPDAELLSHYGASKNPVKKRSLLHHLNKDILTSNTIIRFGTGFTNGKARKVKNRGMISSFLMAFNAALQASKERSRALSKQNHKEHNASNGKSKQYNHNDVGFDIELERPISLAACSPKKIAEICEAGIAAQEENDFEMGEYARYAIQEDLLRGCDRRMQAYSQTPEYEAFVRSRHRKKEALDAENFILSAENADEVKEGILGKLKLENALIDMTTYNQLSRTSGEPKQRDVKRDIDHFEGDIDGAISLNNLLHVAYAMNGGSLKFSTWSPSDEGLRVNLMNGGANIHNHEEVAARRMQGLYTRYANEIALKKPHLVPGPDASVEERIAFSDRVGFLYNIREHRKILTRANIS